MAAYPQDGVLSEKLNAEYRSIIEKTSAGREFYSRFDELRKKKPPRVLLRYSSDSGLASYAIGKDTIYLNTKYIRIFFGIKGYSDLKIIKAFNTDSKVRAEFVKYSDGAYFHELIHCLQDAKYGKSRYIKYGGLFLEFEYEAYLLGDMYFHEKMLADRKLFKDLLSGRYGDIYTNSDLDGYLSVTADPEKYRKDIAARYRRELGGYVDLDSEALKRKARLEESKILYMAGGENFKAEEKDLKALEKHRAEYRKFLEDFYARKWPSFGAEAFSYILEVSTEAGNFPLALELSSEAESNISSYRLSPEQEKRLKTSCALVFLQAVSRLTDKAQSMDKEELFLNIYYLDMAAVLTGREFPQSLFEIRKSSYLSKIRELLKTKDLENDEEAKKEKSRVLKFLIDSVSKNYGLKENEISGRK
ncbi:MAG: hypothetical protein Fur0012_04570 [Elusimicrobiota bacterium]